MAGIYGLNIWPEYGHVAITTPDGWRIDNLDIGDDPLTGRTNTSGQCLIAAVYTKDEDAFLDEDWVPYPGALLPNDWITTWVELKITIIKHGEPIREVYVWSTFQRVQDQHFWGQSGPPPVAGLIDISPSGIGHWMEGGMMNGSFDSSPLSPVELPADKSFAPVSPKGKLSNYSPSASVLKRAGRKSSSGPEYGSGSGITVDWLEWDQFVYKYGYWDWASNFGIPVDWYLVWFETDDPNEIRMIMDSSQPYCLWSQVTLAQPAEPHTTTTVVRSIDPNGETASQMYLFNYPYSTSDNITYIIYSNFLILVDNTEDQGYYYDSWGNLYTVIYVPLEGYVRVDGSNRDFNLDGKINWSDFALLADHWQQDSTDPDSSYDGFFEDMNNPEGIIGLGALLWFSQEWLSNTGYPDLNSGGESMLISETVTVAAAADQQISEVQPQAEPSVEEQIAQTKEILDWLEKLWAEDEQLRKEVDQADWGEFIAAVEAYLKDLQDSH